VITLGATAAGVVAAGAYIRWAVRPVIGAYRLGRRVGGNPPAE
jgi:hypothetical protein